MGQCYLHCAHGIKTLSPAALAVSFDYPFALLLPATWVEGSYSLRMELFPGEVKQRVKALDWKGEVRA